MAKHPLMPHPLRFWLKTTITEGDCVLWSGTMHDTGYGIFNWKYPLRGAKQRRNWFAHRWILTYMNGPIPDGLVVRHKCHTRSCVNPDHLEIGTYSDNNWDTLEAGRHFSQKKTHCKWGHEYTPESHYIAKDGGRVCVACEKRNGLATAAKRRALRTVAV